MKFVPFFQRLQLKNETRDIFPHHQMHLLLVHSKNMLMRVDCNTHYVLPLEGSREACNPHQAVYLTDVV